MLQACKCPGCRVYGKVQCIVQAFKSYNLAQDGNEYSSNGDGLSVDCDPLAPHCDQDLQAEPRKKYLPKQWCELSQETMP